MPAMCKELYKKIIHVSAYSMILTECDVSPLMESTATFEAPIISLLDHH